LRKAVHWTNDEISLLSNDDGETMFFAIKHVPEDEESYYFCRDGKVRTMAVGKSLDGIYVANDSAHYKSVQDFLTCHPSLIKDDTWTLNGAL
jgi:hypothetical protein